MKVNIEILSGPSDGESFSFRNSFAIGRDNSSELPLTLDKFISRHHAKIFLNDNECVLEDLNSTNGTFVDNNRLSGSTKLSKGQIFRVGRTWLQIAW